MRNRGGRQQPLKAKLVFSFTGILLIVVVLAVFNVFQLNRMKTKVDVQNGKAELEHKALELEVLVQDLKDLSSGLMISRNLSYVEKYQEKRKQFNEMIRTVGDTASTDAQYQWRSKLIMASTDFLDIFDRSVAIIKDHSLKEEDIRRNTETLFNQAQEQRDVIFDLVNKFDVDYGKDAEAAVSATYAMMSRIKVILISASAAVLLMSILISVLLIRSFMQPIRRLQNAVSVLSSGDLRHRIDNQSADELGLLSRDFDNMSDKVRVMLSGTQSIASSLSGYADSFRTFSRSTAEANEHVLKAIDEIAVGADQQAAHSEKSAQILQDVSEDVDGIFRFTDTLLEAGSQAARHTNAGAGAVEALQQSSSQSDELVEHVARAMKDLLDGSAQIGKIVTAMADIANQTNVLALNAAIEAARAGAAGRGFAIVADQIRVLSAESRSASKQIGTQITGLQKQIDELNGRMNSAREGIREQNGQVEETLKAFVLIRGSMNQMNGMTAQVRDKVGSVHQKNKLLIDAVQFVAAIAEETAAAVQEVSSTSTVQDTSIRQIAAQAEEIYKLSQQLFEQMGYFQIGTGI